MLVGLALALALAAPGGEAQAQKSQARDEAFVAASPAVGEPLPDLTLYTPDGKEFRTAGLRGRYAVVVFGCLT
jgi:cytochrome oxidase Cu insertion factor (SCO1/SenC/PrrC family)